MARLSMVEPDMEISPIRLLSRLWRSLRVFAQKTMGNSGNLEIFACSDQQIKLSEPH